MLKLVSKFVFLFGLLCKSYSDVPVLCAVQGSISPLASAFTNAASGVVQAGKIQTFSSVVLRMHQLLYPRSGLRHRISLGEIPTRAENISVGVNCSCQSVGGHKG